MRRDARHGGRRDRPGDDRHGGRGGGHGRVPAGRRGRAWASEPRHRSSPRQRRVRRGLQGEAVRRRRRARAQVGQAEQAEARDLPRRAGAARGGVGHLLRHRLAPAHRLGALRPDDAQGAADRPGPRRGRRPAQARGRKLQRNALPGRKGQGERARRCARRADLQGPRASARALCAAPGHQARGSRAVVSTRGFGGAERERRLSPRARFRPPPPRRI